MNLGGFESSIAISKKTAVGGKAIRDYKSLLQKQSRAEARSYSRSSILESISGNVVGNDNKQCFHFGINVCDTFVALADATLNGDVIFGKNSDRPNGEVQDVVSCPATRNDVGDLLQCTSLQIPQAKQTYAVILSKPRWMWGAEMGANEHGVAIGNEAVWTTEAYSESGLLGMDLVRLGLERGASALEALHVIVDLMAAYGQGGNCAEHFDMTYHNSYLLADPAEAWVLETAGSYWVAEQITSGTRSISNGLSIHGKGDLRHPELDRKMDEGFDFAHLFSPPEAWGTVSPLSREGRVRQLCQQSEGVFSLQTAKSVLRDHSGGVCMHGDFETRGSQVSTLTEGGCEHWFIEGPFPCQEKYQKRVF